MTRVLWDVLPHEYQVGVDRGVFYPKNAPGEVWNGLVAINEDSTDSDVKSRYIDGVPTRHRSTPGHFSGTIEAVTYPASFHNDVFGRRISTGFGLSYRVQTETRYQIHVVYNVLISPSQYVRQQSPFEPFRWGFTTTPMTVPDANPTAHLIIDAGTTYSWTLQDLEDVLYGSDTETPHLPTPTEIFEIFEENAILRIIDHGDGTWSAIGPDEAIQMLDADTFEISWPSAVYLDADTYTIHSL